VARPDGSPGLLVVPDRFDPVVSLGWQVAAWIERHLCHGPGDVLGDPILLDDEWRGFLVAAYGLDPTNGRRLVSRAFLSRAKGRSKSELAGMVVCAEFLGDVRFDHWATRGEVSEWGYAFEEGEPVGRPVRSPFIRCLATEEGQAGNTYEVAAVMLDYAARKFPEEFGSLDLGRTAQTSTRIFLPGGGEIRPCTASSAAKDGGLETFVVKDETHLWHTRELRQMDATVSRNTTKRKIAEPWTLETSTMFDPTEQSIARDGRQYAEAIVAGKKANLGLLFDHREGTVPDEWDDDAAVLAGLREAYGPASEWTDFAAKLGDIRDPKTSKADSVRYFFNVATQTDRAAVDLERWRSLANPGERPAAGAAIAIGFDGSFSNDSTVLYGCVVGERPHLFLIAAWERPRNAPKDWRVPRAEVHAEVDRTMRQWRVGRMLCDPPRWESEVDEWARKYGDDRVLAYDTNQHTARMWQACSRFASAVEEGALTHDGDPLLERHLAATARRKVRANDDDADGRTRFVFVKADGRGPTARKIDATIAAVLALEGASTMPPPARARFVNLAAVLAESAGDV
jgi:hypothetical protein